MPDRLRRLALDHPVTTFAALTCGFSWSLWLLAIASSRGWVGFRFHPGPIGSFGPAFGAIVMAALAGGRASVRSLLGGLRRGRARPALYVFALLVPVVLQSGALAIAAASSGTAFAPAALDQWPMLVPVALLILVLGGPLGEEIGWRGWLLPRLIEKHTPIAATLLLGGLWAVWHFPAFFLPGAAQQGSSMVLFTVMAVSFAMLFTWLWLASEGNLLLAVLMHTAINTCAFVMPTVFPALAEDAATDVAWIALVLAAAVATATLAPRMRAVGQTGSRESRVES